MLLKAQQTQVGLQADLALMPAENHKHHQNSPFKLQLAANCLAAAEERRRNREILQFNSL